ncbi:NAD-dependent epimerase/dehydratase family protein [Curtobacterium luteum]|uniref:NAD-dependent epimerase/dehydratase family protein n=1 Tax=Curtobacterium luteum TaxID=33881 RepID=UPI00381D7432
MRALVLGGTGWLGSVIVRDLVASGVEVTCMARGESGAVPDGARWVPADRLAPDAYDPVRGEWDEVIELSHEPELVRPALAELADSAAHWTLVSTVSVYARNDEPGADESAGVVEPTDLTAYPDAKVAAERSSTDWLGPRLLIARPGLIVGPGDPSDRFGYWPARLSKGGPALVPTSAGRFVQVIDVADLSSWISRVAREGRVGIVNTVGDVVPMRAFFDRVAAVTRFDGTLVEVEDEVLLANDVRFWAGPRSLPLWLPLADAALARRSARTFQDAGGRLRPLEATVADVLADERSRGLDRPRGAGLTTAEEQRLLQTLR